MVELQHPKVLSEWTLTPIRQQYLAIKRQYPDIIVFFRLGDFYETFDDDAKIVSAELEIVLTSREMGRGQRVPLAGIPYHSVDAHLTKLIGRGHKVAIVEQVGDPATSKGLVEREVVRVVTPGTVLEPQMLEAKSNNYLAAVVVDGNKAGVACVDITTGEFSTTQLSGTGVLQLVVQEIQRLHPAECLLPREDPRRKVTTQTVGFPSHVSTHVTQYDAWHFELERCRQRLLEHFGVISLEGFGCASLPLAIRAAGAILQYLDETQKVSLTLLEQLSTYSTDTFMVLDAATRQNLELIQTSRAGSIKGSLLWVLDRTQTPMGGRLLRRWVNQPLLDITLLKARQEAVGEFFSNGVMRAKVAAVLEQVGDLERIVNRVTQGVATPRDLVMLKNSLVMVPEIRNALSQGGSLKPAPIHCFHGDVSGPAPSEMRAPIHSLQRDVSGRAPLTEGVSVQSEVGVADKAARTETERELNEVERQCSRIDWLLGRLDPCEEVAGLLAEAIIGEPPNSLADGGVIASGFSAELDNLRGASTDARQWIAKLELAERERTGIKSLKVGYNRVFGYYLEVTNPNLDQKLVEGLRGQTPKCDCKTVREHLERCLGYIRKQTLVGAERYITPDLKEQEAFILSAQERIVDLETSIFKQVCQQVSASRNRVLGTVQAIAHLDVFVALAEVAVRNKYVCPELDAGDEICIVGGRHPVVELTMQDDRFVPNDAHLSNQDAQVVLLTGPNMAGKSTYILMVGVVTLMAQIGSFVPAEYARIGVVDRIFTRVGAQHDISAGQSTFLVEMSEASQIIAHATPRSLLIFDEVGRGTSTYDGMAIARAIVEHIHNHPRLGCKTLFATHNHELTDLEGILPRVRNYRVDVLEEGGQVVFLHRVVRGGADRSYGIHVAKLAGMPKGVIRRAEEVLKELESRANGRLGDLTERRRIEPLQLSLFAEPDPLVEEIKSLDVLSMTPLEALTKLFELQKKAKQRNRQG